MTRQQFVEEIKQLSVADRIALIEVISRSVREDLEAHDGASAIASDISSPAAQDVRARKLAAVQRLRGALKFDGPPPSGEEVKDAYTNYLQKKYS